MLSEKKARLIAENLAKTMFQKFDESVLSVCIVGSLASGDFVEGKSDLDLVVILKDNEKIDVVRRYVEKWIEDTETSAGLKNQIEVFIKIKKALYPPYNLKKQGMLEIARMIYQAEPIVGNLDMKAIPMPPVKLFEEEYADLKRTFLEQKKNRKLILKYMRYINLLNKGIVEFNKEQTMKIYFEGDSAAYEALQNIFKESEACKLEKRIEEWMLKNFFK